MIPYLVAPTPITHTQLNLLVSSLREKFRTMFGGRAPALAFKANALTSVNGGVTYHNVIPAELLGQCFFFNGGGPTPYSTLFPGYINRTAVVDGVSIEVARPYDHAPFVAAAAALALVAQDDTDHIATVATAGAASYTNGLPLRTYPFPDVTGVSLFDNSLCAHGRLLTPPNGSAALKYYLREQNRPGAEKIHRHAIAEIIIEGTTSVTLPLDTQYPTVIASKYERLRFWNMQPVPCVTNLGTIAPFQCLCVRRTWNATTHLMENPRTADYFFDYEAGDPRHWVTLASEPFNNKGSNQTSTAGWPGAAIHGLATLLDWVRTFAGRSDLYAQFLPDVHELCDLVALNRAEMAAKFSAIDPASGGLRLNAKVGDLVQNQGKLRIAKVSTTPAPAPNADKFLEAWDEVTFTGYHDLPALVSAFALKGITVTSVGGVLQLKNNDSQWSLDLIHWQSNMLKNVDHGGAAAWYVLRQGARIDSGHLLESKVYESNGGVAQDALGYGAFDLAAASGYKILQRAVVSSVRNRSYTAPNGSTLTVPGVPAVTISEVALQANTAPAGIHAATAQSLLELGFIGDASRASQDDEHVSFTGSRLTLTPQGWVLTFTESVRSDVAPVTIVPVAFVTNDVTTRLSFGVRYGTTNTNDGDRVAVAKPGTSFEPAIYVVNNSGPWSRANDLVVQGTVVVTGRGSNAGLLYRLQPAANGLAWVNTGLDPGTGTTEYVNTFGRPFEFNSTTERFELKHKVWFRKHGLGFHHHGRIHAACHTPFNGRLIASGWTRENTGPDGADVTLPGDGSETDVKLARTLGPLDLTTITGGRLFQSSAASPLDSLLALGRNYATPYWYQTREPTPGSNTPRERIIGNSTPAAARGANIAGNSQVFMALSSVQYNLVAEVLNQLKIARPLDWRAFRFVQGAHVLHLDPLANISEAGAPGMYLDGGGLRDWRDVFGGTPAPLDAALGISSAAPATVQAAWRAFFSARGVTELSGPAALPPSWAQFQNQFNQQRDLEVTFTGRFLGPVSVTTRQYYRSGIELVRTWTGYNATLEVRGVAALTAPVNTLPVGTAVLALSNSVATVALPTAYTALKWITWSGLQALCNTFDYELNEVEEFVPLALDWLEAAESVLTTDGLVPDRTWSYQREVTGSLAGSAGLNTYMATAIPATVIHPLTTRLTFHSRRIAFRLHGQSDDTSAPEWKLAVATSRPPEIYSLTKRTRGRSTTHQWHFHALARYFSSNDFGGGAPASTGLINPGQPAGSGLTALFPQGHLTVPPWHTADVDMAWPGLTQPDPYQMGVIAFPAGSGSQANPWTAIVSLVAYNFAEQMSLSLELPAPLDVEKQRRVENMQRWINAEQHWIASQVIGSGGKTYRLIPQPGWAAVQDWWSASPDAFLQHVLVAPSPVPRDLPLAAAALAVYATDGLTILRPAADSAARVFYPPRSPIVPLP